MFSTIYFALCSGLARRATLPAYAAAMLDGATERAYCTVDEVLDCSARKLGDTDVARLVAAADASLLLGYDEDAEELFRRAQKFTVNDNDRLRIMSCRNTGWQLMMRDRYSTTAKCFARIVHDDAATAAERTEALIGFALVQHQLGRQRDADNALLEAAALADGHEDPGWRLVIALLAREFDVQLRIRTSTTLSDHAFWSSAYQVQAQSGNDRAEITRRLTDASAVLAPLPALITQRHDYLERLAALAGRDRMAAAPLLEIAHQAHHFRSGGQSFLAKIDIALAAFAGGLDDVAETALGRLGRAETEIATRRCNFDYLFCVSRIAARQGNPVQALKLYASYTAEALRCLRSEAPESGAIHPQASRALAVDDLSARLPAKYRRAYRYIVENLERADLTTREVASQIGVTERALQMTFKRWIGIAPGGLIRKLRLEGIRSELLSEERVNGSIVDTASRWGVKSRSVLAKGYRRQFNESPSETIHR
jgi:AraC-like DNA-binding protein